VTRRFALLLPMLAVTLTACTAAPPPEAWALGDGTVLELDLGEDSTAEADDARVRYRLASGLTVSVQELARAERMPGGQRTVRSVTEALQSRLELGERPGSLVRTACAVSGVRAECLSGWMERDGTRFARHGAVFEAGDRIVWLDVAGPDEQRDQVSSAARRILNDLHVEVSSAGS
jgi:hypothetical protein